MTALRAFFDGSHDGGGWTNGKHITLAGFAIDETLLPEFEARWNAVLADSSERPAAPYIHMRELRRHHDGIFSNQAGWTDPKRGSLIAHLLMYLQTIPKTRCRMFGCTLDLDDYRRLKAEGSPIAGPLQVCNHFCPHLALAWYIRHFPGLATELHYLFDKDEPFRHPFQRKWLRAKNNHLDVTGNKEAWQLIRNIDSADSHLTPGLQAADMLAWATTRRFRAREGDFMKHLHHMALQIIPSTTAYLRYDDLKKVVITEGDFSLDIMPQHRLIPRQR
jgi:hypothetical protein